MDTLGHKGADLPEPKGHGVVSSQAAFIIHLGRATQRAPQVERLQAALPIPSEIVPAVDASAETTCLQDHYDPNLGWSPPYPFALSATEIAVFLSHREAWRRIILGGHEAGLVLEDDVALDPVVFPVAFDLAARHLMPGGVIRFPWRGYEAKGDEIGTSGAVQLIRPRLVALGMQAQLVHRDAARRLLEVTGRFDRPVDTVMQLTWKTGVETLAVVPSGVAEMDADLGGSTQRRHARKGGWLYTEFARALYRRRLAAMSKRAQHP